MKDFRFDVPLEQALFSYDPPPGYSTADLASLLPATGVPLASEEALVEALRAFTKLSGGKFPKSLSNWSDWLDVLEDPESEETKMLTARLGVIFVFLSDMAKDDYEYLGDEKSTDDDSNIVFWHWNAEGTLRAVYRAGPDLKSYRPPMKIGNCTTRRLHRSDRSGQLVAWLTAAD